MRPTRLMAAGIATAWLLAGCTGSAPGDGAPRADGSTQATTGPLATSASPKPAAPRKPGAPTASTGAAEPTTPSTSAPDGGKKPATVSELPTATAKPTGSSLPEPKVPVQAHVTLPLPAKASARGKLVAGFPADVVPIPPHTDVVTSSVAGTRDRLRIDFAGTSATRPRDLLRFYRKAFGELGFIEKSSPAAKGAVATTFIRGGDGVLVTVTIALGGASQLSVTGTLQAAPA